MPWINFLIAVVVGGVTFLHPMTDIQSKDLASLIATLSVTLLGFVITALAILTAVPDKSLMVKMKEYGHYEELTRHFFICALSLLVTLLISVANVIYVDSTTTAVLLGFLALSLSNFSVAGWEFYQVMKFV